MLTLPQVASLEEYPKLIVEVKSSPAPKASNAVEWNVSLVRAPQAWALGYDGTGITVGSIDTGVRWTHNALKSKYRGWNGTTADHNYNWWDPVFGRSSPYDHLERGHGTQTTGVMVGDDGQGNQVGVAPGAKWIASNGVIEEDGYTEWIESGQFMLAPWDLNHQNANSDLRPKVVGNSWGVLANEITRRCTDTRIFYDMITQWRSADIFPSFSVGNENSNRNSWPAAYPHAFDVGNVIQDFSTGAIRRSTISSVGPSCFDPNDQLPQIMAGGGENPQRGGPQVRSSSNLGDDQYTYQEGTSLSQPAVAGAVAIIRQVNQQISVDEIENIFRETAFWDPAWESDINPATGRPCSEGLPQPRPNPCYGYGLLQIDAAVIRVIEKHGTPTPSGPTPTPGGPTPTPGGPPPTPTPTHCPIYFEDVPPTVGRMTPTPIGYTVYYHNIRCLACPGVISGTEGNSFYFNPCIRQYEDKDLSYFRPCIDITRGQVAKFVSNAAGFYDPIPDTQQTFQDVPPEHPFWLWIERLVLHEVVVGYEGPIMCPGGGRCYRPSDAATRGQVMKMVALAAELGEPITGQSFADVPTDHPFYLEIERVKLNGGVGAYMSHPCGTGAINPCTDQEEVCDKLCRPYFRPCLPMKRDEATKPNAVIFFPDCHTPPYDGPIGGGCEAPQGVKAMLTVTTTGTSTVQGTVTPTRTGTPTGSATAYGTASVSASETAPMPSPTSTSWVPTPVQTAPPPVPTEQQHITPIAPKR